MLTDAQIAAVILAALNTQTGNSTGAAQTLANRMLANLIASNQAPTTTTAVVALTMGTWAVTVTH